MLLVGINLPCYFLMEVLLPLSSLSLSPSMLQLYSGGRVGFSKPGDGVSELR